MAEGGWGSNSPSGIGHPQPGVGYMTTTPQAPPPQFQVFPVPNYPPPMNGFSMPPPPIQFNNDIYSNVAPATSASRGRGTWGYSNNFGMPTSRASHIEKNFGNYNANTNYNANIPLSSPIMEVNTAFGVNPIDNISNIDRNRGNVVQENVFHTNDMNNDNIASRGRGGGVRGRGGGRGRRGGRRRSYGTDRGGANSGYRPEPIELAPADSDELKRAGRDRALAETAAFMRNLSLGTSAESASNTNNSINHNVEFENANRMMRGTSRQRPDRGRGGSYGPPREYYSGEKPGKDLKNRQVRTERFSETFHNKSSKSIKERNGGYGKSAQSESDIKSGSMHFEESNATRSEGLIEQMTKGVYECMVCCDRIKQQHAIWSCLNCYNSFHLGCIKKWAKTSTGDGGWRCPACQGFTVKVPNTYLCFCGKVREPEHSHRETPHSCGEVCGRKRKIEWCNHKCNILCHPGPCPPCTAFIRRSCPCGAETRDVRCSMTESFLCGNECKKSLNCKGHQCKAKCHVGPCEDCTQTIKQDCFCGKEQREIPCTEESYSVTYFECGNECSKLLQCKNHKCLSKCHSGVCHSCDKSVEAVLRCPCNKVPLEKIYERDGVSARKSCTDPIPTCGQVCGRKLKCGLPGSYHECQAMCHEGPCPPCPLKSPVKCRCGNLQQMLNCSELKTKADEVRCNKACKKMRECGRHKCGIRCCIDIDHLCTLVCGRFLTCGLHKCNDNCHRGNCHRCIETSFDELPCHCGAQITYPPVACGTKPPECNNPCTRAQICSHPPTHNCHPEDNCPPCTILVDKMCFGNHKTMKSTPCYLKAMSCGLICNKPLPCGQHNCLLVCHEQPCVPPGGACPQKCLKARSSCGHPCASPCHTGPCPDVTCKEMVTITCECGHRSTKLKCSENDREYRAMTTSLLASQMQNMNSGCSVDISEIFTATARPDKLRRLACNEECKTIDRNKRLAMALQIENPEAREVLGNSSNIYSDFMKDEARKDANLAKMVHDALTELVLKAKESKQKSRSHSFAPMNREKRRFIHEYCEHFGCQSQAYDEEPKKNVVATAVKGMCYLPPFSVLTLVQREQGQKKVPGPVWSRKVLPS